MQERLDVRMVREAITASREKAKRLIQAGRVSVDGVTAVKAGQMISEDAAIAVAGEVSAYVGRGGEKLEKVLSGCGLSLNGMVCMDVGASTGGFTDCMLRHGAKKVYAVDVGYNQLAESLRMDERVVNVEKTNVRYLEEGHFGEKMNFAAIDVSFISLAHMFAPVAGQMLPGGKLACLIKPQFEAGRENLNKHGIVRRDKKLHAKVIFQVMSQAMAAGFSPFYLDYSPITGGDGNIEYLMCAMYHESDSERNAFVIPIPAERIEEVADEAFLYHCQSGKGRK